MCSCVPAEWINTTPRLVTLRDRNGRRPVGATEQHVQAEAVAGPVHLLPGAAAATSAVQEDEPEDGGSSYITARAHGSSAPRLPCCR